MRHSTSLKRTRTTSHCSNARLSLSLLVMNTQIYCYFMSFTPWPHSHSVGRSNSLSFLITIARKLSHNSNTDTAQYYVTIILIITPVLDRRAGFFAIFSRFKLNFLFTRFCRYSCSWILKEIYDKCFVKKITHLTNWRLLEECYIRPRKFEMRATVVRFRCSWWRLVPPVTSST